MLHKFRIALAATMVALAAMSAVDSASANPGYYSVSGSVDSFDGASWWYGFP